jgi:hypothetical protein
MKGTIWGAAALLAAVMLTSCSSTDTAATAPSQPPATTAAATPTPDRVTLENSCRAALRAEYEAGFAPQGNDLPPSAKKPVCTVLDRPTIKRLADEAVADITGG